MSAVKPLRSTEDGGGDSCCRCSRLAVYSHLMKIIARSCLAALLLAVLTNCTQIFYVEIFNNTEKRMSCGTLGNEWVVYPGQSARMTPERDMNLRVKIDGSIRTFRILGPQPNKTYIVHSGLSVVARLQLNTDCKLYAVRVSEHYPSRSLDQPANFPLLATEQR